MFNPWPAFNVADSAILVGVVLLLLETFRGRDTATDRPEQH
jgi:signal peptidase II